MIDSRSKIGGIKPSFFMIKSFWFFILTIIGASLFSNSYLGHIGRIIIVIALYFLAYWYGLLFICLPLISKVFKLFRWNKDLAFAISSIAWFGVIGFLGVKLEETEFYMWFMRT